MQQETIRVDNEDLEMVDRDEADNAVDMDSLMEKQAEIASAANSKEMSTTKAASAEKENDDPLFVTPPPELTDPSA